MRYLFISDIHGVKTNLELIKKRFNEMQCDKLIVLGDLFYYGPKSMGNEDYDAKYVVDFLNDFKDKIICVKGNCDSSVDECVCSFPIISELGVVEDNGKEIYITHGHIFNQDKWNKDNTILVYGHKHIPFIVEKNNSLFLNPGSISLPKEDYPPTYMVFSDNVFTIYDVLGNIIAKKKI